MRPGTWIDHTDRMRVVRTGIALQCAGVGVALVIIFAFVERYPDRFGASEAAAAANSSIGCGALSDDDLLVQGDAAPAPEAPGIPFVSLLLLIVCGVSEAVGAMISAVSAEQWTAAEVTSCVAAVAEFVYRQPPTRTRVSRALPLSCAASPGARLRVKGEREEGLGANGVGAV